MPTSTQRAAGRTLTIFWLRHRREFAGASLAEPMRQTRHESTEIALGYLRPADLWRNNVTEKLFRGRAS